MTLNSADFRLHGRATQRRRGSSFYTPYGWRAARSNHPGGVNVAMADGSERFVGNEVDTTVWK